MTGQPDDDHRLDALFHAARAHPETPGSDLIARVLADAETEQARLQEGSDAAIDGDAHSSARPSRGGGFAGLRNALGLGGWDPVPIRALGGWPVTVGLAAVACTGIWIGAAPPAPLAVSAQLILSDSSSGFGDWSTDTGFGLSGEFVE